MNITLPTLAVAFAAICVWLSVRIVNRREPWAKWTLAAAIGAPVLYVASFGPACWATAISSQDSGTNYHKAMIVYWPLGFAAKQDGRIAEAVKWWMRFGTRHGQATVVPTTPRGTHVVGFGPDGLNMEWLD